MFRLPPIFVDVEEVLLFPNPNELVVVATLPPKAGVFCVELVPNTEAIVVFVVTA